MLLIGLGSFVAPGVGTITGLVCLLLSHRWTSREKTIATLLAALPAVVGLLL
ncbi:MAG: hypothetical protein H7233_05610, partial [Pseudorhodobacter sp.]|nr:hypothetical protein [Frankiaceae bacterium]